MQNTSSFFVKGENMALFHRFIPTLYVLLFKNEALNMIQCFLDGLMDTFQSSILINISPMMTIISLVKI